MHLFDPTFWLLAGSLPLMGLSLLGGGGGLGISGQSSTSTKATSGGAVNVYNGSSGPISQQSWLIIGAVALFGLLIFGMIFRAKRS